MEQIALWVTAHLTNWTMLLLALGCAAGSAYIYVYYERTSWRLAITTTFVLFVIFYGGQATGVLVSPYDRMMARITVGTFFLNAMANHRTIHLRNRHGNSR